MADKFKQFRADIRNATLTELIDLLARQSPENYGHRAIMAEITRLQAEAQIGAAEAAKETAAHSGRMTTYMLWSVVVLTITAIVNVVIAIFS